MSERPYTQKRDKGMLERDYKQVGLDQNNNFVELGDDNPQTLALTHTEVNAASRRKRADGSTRKTGVKQAPRNESTYAAARQADARNGK